MQSDFIEPHNWYPEQESLTFSSIKYIMNEWMNEWVHEQTSCKNIIAKHSDNVLNCSLYFWCCNTLFSRYDYPSLKEYIYRITPEPKSQESLQKKGQKDFKN